MKSLRTIVIVFLLLLTIVIPSHANWFTENKTVIKTTTAIATITGCFGFGIKYYFDWKKRSSAESYEKAIDLMKKFIEDPFSNKLAIEDGVITKEHVDHFQTIKNTVWISAQKKDVVDALANARSKNGKRYHPLLDRTATKLYESFENAYSKFQKTFNTVNSFCSLISAQQTTTFYIKDDIEYAQQLKQLPNPLHLFTSNSRWWLVDAHTKVLRYYSALISNLNILKQTLANIAAYNHQVTIVTDQTLINKAEESITFLSNLLTIIRTDPSYDKQLQLLEEHNRYQEELERQRKKEEELKKEIACLRSDMHLMQAQSAVISYAARPQVNQNVTVRQNNVAPRDNAREQQLQTELDRTRNELNNLRNRLDTFRREVRAEGLV